MLKFYFVIWYNKFVRRKTVMSYYLKTKNVKEQLKFNQNKNGFVCDNSNRAIIDIGAENYDDIFSQFCYKGGDTLSSNLVEYLQQKANAIPLEYDLTMRFHVKGANEEKRNEISLAVKENYKSAILGIEKRMKRTLIFSMWFLLIGLMFCTTYLLLSNIISKPISYLLDLLAWVFLWEGIDAFFLDRRFMQLEKYKLYRLFSAKIETIEFEPY